MTMTVDWDFKQKTKEPKNWLQGSVIFMLQFSMVLNPSKDRSLCDIEDKPLAL